MRLYRLGVVAIIGLLTQFTLSVNAQLAPNDLPYQRLGVISLVAKDFHQSYVGLTVFNNHIETNDISNWKVDDEYEDRVSEFISRETSYKTVPIHGTWKRLSKVYDNEGIWKSHSPQWQEVTEALKRIAAESQVDALVVIIGTYANDTAEAKYPGVGVYAWRRESMLYINAMVALVDGQTGKVIATSPVGIGSGKRSMFQLNMPLLPRRPIAGYYSRKTFSDLDAASLNECLQSLITLPDRAWPYTLHVLFSPASSGKN